MKTLKENWAVLLLTFVCVYIMYLSSSKSEKLEQELEQYKREMDSIQKIKDSLYDVLLPTEIELGRHQVAFQIFVERNPKCAEEYATIISEETE